MTTRFLFCAYIIVSLFAAQYYTSGESADTLFGYGTLVDAGALSSATNFLLAGLVAFLAGSYASGPAFSAIGGRLTSARRPHWLAHMPAGGSIPSWQVLGLGVLAAIYTYWFLASFFENGLPTSLAERVFESKLSAFFMVILAYFGYSASLYKNSLLFRVVVFTISLAVVVIDGSRSGLVPLVGLLAGAITSKRRLTVLLIVYVLFFGASYSITARLLDDRFSFEVLKSYLIPDVELTIEAFRFTFDYVFAFSILNFSYMAFVSVPEFTGAQLLTSLNPLPSYFLDPYLVDSLRFDDRTRAIGGPAELLLVDPIFFIAGFSALGVLSAYADTIVKSRFKFIVLMMFLLATIIFFQYSLRTSVRMLTAIGLVVFLLRHLLKSGNSR
jgi:hypothetical protein